MVNQTDVLKLHTEYLSDYLDAVVMLPLINNNKSYDLYKAQVTSDIKKFTDALNQEFGITHFTYKIYGYTIYIIENDSHNFIKIYDRQTIKEIEVYGYIPFVTHIKQIINDNLHLVGPMIQWVYTDIGDEIRIPLDTSTLPTTAMYPFLNGDTLESYYQRFLDSNANVLILIGPPGTGKCLGKGTPILMYDGSIKKVEDVVVGDKLMGDDSTPRQVLTLSRGREQMYQINQKNGDNYVVNESHILSLKNRRWNRSKPKRLVEKFVDISVKYYLTQSNNFKGTHFGYKVAVDYPTIPLILEPYFIGLWLGDGTSVQPSITTADAKIVEYLQEQAIIHNLTLVPRNTTSSEKADTYALSTAIGSNYNIILSELRRLNIYQNKHIPIEYLINDRNNRLQLLAGLLDSDGYLDIRSQMFEFSNTNELLITQVITLARSLGFKVSVHDKYTSSATGNKKHKSQSVYISGHLDQIPTKLDRKKANSRKQIKDPLHTSIEIVKLDVDDYYGFEIDGNKRFLLGDFTVTHNTSWLKGLLNYSKSSATVTYDPNILNQDSVFANFMDDRQSSFLILEDSDTFLSSRCDGNNMMHKFLNLSNGLISNNNKKLIFSTNLPSIRDVDPALTRPGRCFDVLNFGLLTPEQATIVAQEHNIEYTGTTNCTLAEVFNSSFKHVAPSFGFNA